MRGTHGVAGAGGDVGLVPATAGPASRATIRDLGRADLAFAVAGHAEHLPAGFFVRLGPRFMTAYYRGFADSPYGVALVAESDGRRVGALVGTTCQASHYRWLLRRRGVALALTGVASLAVRPAELGAFARGRLWRYARAIPRMVSGKVLGRRGHGPGPDVDLTEGRLPGEVDRDEPPTGVAVLHHVFVSPQASSSGVGSALVERFEGAARSGGADEARLVTMVDGGGRSAVGFYERAGWTVCDRRRDRDGRDVVELAVRLR